MYVDVTVEAGRYDVSVETTVDAPSELLVVNVTVDSE